MAKYQKNEEKAEADRAEVEKIEAAKAAFKKRENADMSLRKATAKVQRKLKAKARKEAAANRLESEKVEGSGMRGREEWEISVTIGSFLTEHGVEWMVKEGVVCESCVKKENMCFWRMEAGQGKTCLASQNLKKSCLAGGVEESEAEARLSKRRKVEGKGKGKEKAASLNSGVAESAVTDVLRDILKVLKGLHAEVGDLHVFALFVCSPNTPPPWRRTGRGPSGRSARAWLICVGILCWITARAAS